MTRPKFDTAMDASGFEKGANKLTDFVKGIGAFKLLEKGFQMVAASIGSAVSRVDTLNKFPKIMEQMGYGAEAGGKAIQKLSDGIQGLPTTLDSIVGSTQRLAIATGSLDKGTDTALALNNGLLASGASSDAAARGAEQYIQALSRGKIDAQEWKTLMEVMPYAMQKVAEAFGFTGTNAVEQLKSALSSGEITMTDFNNTLLTLNNGIGGFAEVAQTASGGIETSWGNVQTAIVRGTANVIQAVDNGLAKFGGIAGVMDKVKGAVNTTFTAIAGGANLLMQNLDKVAASAIGVGTAFASYKAMQAWNTAAKEAATVSKFLADTNQQLTFAVGKSATVQLEQVAATKLQEAQDAQAKYRKLELIATEKLNTAESLKAAAAKAAGTEATRLQAQAEQAATVAGQAQTAAKAASTVANTADTAAVHADIAAQNARNTSMGLGTALIGFLTGSITLHQLATAAATTVTTLFGMAMYALPLVAIIAGIALLVVGIVKLIQWLAAGSKEYQKQKEEVKALKEEQEALTTATKESAATYDDNTAAIAASSKVSKDLVGTLKQVQNGTMSADEKNRKMADTVAQLNASVDGLNISYDEETGAIQNINTGQEISIDQLEQLVDAKSELAQANAWTARYNELIQEQTRIQEDLAVIKAKKQEIMANTELSTREQEKLIKELDAAAEGHAETMTDVQLRLDVVNENIAASDTAMAESVVSDYERMQQAVTKNGENIEEIATQWGVSIDEILAAMERENISLDDWVAKQEDAWADYEASVKERTAGVINSFKEIPGEYDKSAQEMLDILISNKERYAEWEATMEEITRQLGPTAAEEFAKLGPEATSAMQEILDSAELMDEYRDVFGVKLDEVTGLAVEDWNDPDFIGAPAGAIDTSAQMVTENTALDTAVTGQVTSAKETMQAAVDEVDFSTIGQSMAADIVSGITNADMSGITTAIASAITTGSGKVTTAATSMSTSVQTVIKTMSTQSQSAVTQMMTSINSAIISSSGTIKASITSMGNGITTALNSAKTQAVNITSQMMTEINSTIVSRSAAVKSSMTTCANGVVTAVTDMKTKSVTQSEQMMTGINSTITTRTGTVKSSATAVSNGVVDNLKPMVAGAESVTNSMMDGMYKAMQRKAEELYKLARQIANNIRDTMADALDVNSPSRVMIKLFEFVMMGIYYGMEGMSGMLFREADSIADGLALSPDVFSGVYNKLQSISSTNLLGGTALVPLAAGAGAGGGNSTYSPTLVQHINTPKPLSASEMTREGQDMLRRTRWQLP